MTSNFFDRFHKLGRIPALLLIFTISICFIGFVLMYSAAQGNLRPWAFKQMIHFTIFFPLMLAVSIINLRTWYKNSYLLYCVALVLLILVHALGYTAMGATRWVNLGLIKIQPSELMKICIILALARYFHDLQLKEINLKELIIPSLMLVVPAALIIKQPDLGTSLILLMIGIIIFFIAGVKRWFFIVGASCIGAALPIIWSMLHDYQKNRILTFLNPERDPLGSSYNIIQSKIAIGSGGFYGKGFMQGSQSQLQFLPEHQTDFVFTMLCEEWGMVGGVFVLACYSVIIGYGYLIALDSRTKYGKILSLGISSLIFLHVFINTAMTMGLLPTVGVPFPLLSYGGTSMMTIMLGLGIMINVHLHSRHNINSALGHFF